MLLNLVNVNWALNGSPFLSIIALSVVDLKKLKANEIIQIEDEGIVENYDLLDLN